MREDVEHRVSRVLEKVLRGQEHDRRGPGREGAEAEPARERVEQHHAEHPGEGRREDRGVVAHPEEQERPGHELEEEGRVVERDLPVVAGRDPVAGPEHLLRLLRVVAVVEVGQVSLAEMGEDDPEREEEERRGRDRRPLESLHEIGTGPDSRVPHARVVQIGVARHHPGEAELRAGARPSRRAVRGDDEGLPA